ncbi:thiolase domain-containing protein [Spongiibacter sp. UBA1325]|uniref:thiolase domain-containing protein n=2 Tax=Spongiibacter TaxID=630749 RepID=UPI00257FC7AA|nr:thiolase domain-containing protein [Spongiibacter sp. UBA1325]|tara:strand:+ start:20175 stop:21338 length:1164 start_codon:yes stop_codon:yes gene_type:complete
MANWAAVVGVGQTKYQATRGDVSIAGLVREAARRALDDAGLEWGDIDAVIIGKAPDMFEGMTMPELYLTDALGCNGKPMLRVHTAGSVGGSTAIVAASYVQSGVFDRVLTVAYEKQSESNAMWALSNPQPFSLHLNAGAGGYFAPIMREYIRRSGAPDDVGVHVAVKDRLNGARNPLAHLQLPNITTEEVKASPLLWEPLRFLESCPSSDGACAMVISSEALVDESPGKPAWIRGTGMRSEPAIFAGRENVDTRSGRDCAKDVYAQAGISNPRRELDCAEVYVPFSWYEPMWLENLGFADQNKGWELTMSGATSAIENGDIPWNPSGGVLSSNPIGASGMIRFAEAAQQVRGTAGAYQVDGAKTALGHAYGGGAQFYSMWIVGSERA